MDMLRRLISCRIIIIIIITGCSRKTAQSLLHHNFAIVSHRVMWFSSRCSEINW